MSVLDSEWASSFFTLMLLFSFLASGLLALSVYLTLGKNSKRQRLRWRIYGLRELGSRHVAKGILWAFAILLASTQVAYLILSQNKAKDSFEFLSFSGGAGGVIVIGLGLLVEHRDERKIFQVIPFKYYFLSLFLGVMAYFGYVGSHPAPGLSGWISCTLLVIFLYPAGLSILDGEAAGSSAKNLYIASWVAWIFATVTLALTFFSAGS